VCRLVSFASLAALASALARANAIAAAAAIAALVATPRSRPPPSPQCRHHHRRRPAPAPTSIAPSPPPPSPPPPSLTARPSAAALAPRTIASDVAVAAATIEREHFFSPPAAFCGLGPAPLTHVLRRPGAPRNQNFPELDDEAVVPVGAIKGS
jgi:hypothetical protein